MMLSRYVLLSVLSIAVLLTSCIEQPNHYDAIPPGIWRGVLNLDAQPKSLITANDDIVLNKDFSFEGLLPFNFEVAYNGDKLEVTILNGDERLKTEDVYFGRDTKTGKDTVVIDFPIYESSLKLLYEERIMEGNWIVKNRKNYSIPFTAYYGKDFRFSQKKEINPKDYSGKWRVTFDPGTEDEYPAIGLFSQTDDIITGTFLTETGDYRFLEGEIVAGKLYMSCFDGSHAFLFSAKEMEDGTLAGSFRSGKHYKSTWVANRDDMVELPDPFELTFTNGDEDKLDFSFENIDGQAISLSDEVYTGKIKLVQIMGTWCPNCRDESTFLRDYIKNHNTDDIEVIAIGFEKYREKEKAMNALRRYKEKMELPYDLLLGGYASKTETSEKFPILNKIISYPTLLFVDRDNKVKSIHTGFSGPATSEYQDFITEFDQIIESLRNE